MADASANVFGGRVPLPFEAMRRRATLKQGRQDQTNFAEMGASQLEQYGPEGQVWAQRLRSDPRAALKMAKEYGGFQNIEFGLREAAAAGQAAGTRRATGLDLLSPAQRKALAESQAKSADAAQTRTITEMMEGGSGAPGTDGLGRARTAFAVASKNPDTLAKEQRRLAYGNDWDASELSNFYEKRKKELAFIPEVVEQRDRIETLDPKNAQDVLEIMQIWQRAVDEGAVVREGDIRLMQSVGANTIEQAMARVAKLIDKDALPGDIGQGFYDRVLEMTDIREQKAEDAFAGIEALADQAGWNAKARNRAIPYRRMMKALREERAGRKQPASTPSLEGPVMPRTIGGETVNYQRGSDGKWHKVD